MKIQDVQLKHDLSEEDEITFADSDLFTLEPFAKNLSFLFGFPKPLTIIIDGGWGTGKTVFAKQLDNMMGNRSRYINAFAHDYQDDVFTALLLSVKEVVNPKKEEFKELLTNALLHHIAPNLTNELIKKITGGIVNIEQLTKEATQTYIENVKNRQEMLDNFRSELKQCMEKEDPVVILVDELDRCKPKYALQVLEIIKHLYSVPNLHFVLIMNTKQIINTICHEHGCNEKEAKIYLQKFYDFIIPLSSINYFLSEEEYISKSNIKRYIEFKFNEMAKELHHYSPELIDKWKKEQPFFNEGFTDLIHMHKLSLREIDKIFLRLNIIACYPSENPLNIHIFASLLLIQLRESELFEQILNYYETYGEGDEPNLAMNNEIRNFLNTGLIEFHRAKTSWNNIYNSIWSTDAAAVPEAKYVFRLVEHIKYLNFLHSSTPL